MCLAGAIDLAAKVSEKEVWSALINQAVYDGFCWGWGYPISGDAKLFARCAVLICVCTGGSQLPELLLAVRGEMCVMTRK